MLRHFSKDPDSEQKPEVIASFPEDVGVWLIEDDAIRKG